jgi:hypothetical protein
LSTDVATAQPDRERSLSRPTALTEANVRTGGSKPRGDRVRRALGCSLISLAWVALASANQPGESFCDWLRTKPVDVATGPRIVAAYFELDPWRTSWLPRFVLYDNDEVLLSPTGWEEHGVWFSRVKLEPPEAANLRKLLLLGYSARDLDPFYNLAPNVCDLQEVVAVLTDWEGHSRSFEIYGYSNTSAAFTVLAPDPEHPPDALPRDLERTIQTMWDFRHAGASPWRPRYLEVRLTPAPPGSAPTTAWPVDWPGLRDVRTRKAFNAAIPGSSTAGSIEVYLGAEHETELARYMDKKRSVFSLEEGLWSVRAYAPVYPGEWELGQLTRCNPPFDTASFEQLIARKAAKRRLELVTYLLVALAIAGSLRLFSTLALLGWFSGLLMYAKVPMDFLHDHRLLIAATALGCAEIVIDKVKPWRPPWNVAMRVVRPLIIFPICVLALREAPAAQLAATLALVALLWLPLDAARSFMRSRIDTLASRWWSLGASLIEDLGCVMVLWLVHTQVLMGVEISIGFALVWIAIGAVWWRRDRLQARRN